MFWITTRENRVMGFCPKSTSFTHSLTPKPNNQKKKKKTKATVLISFDVVVVVIVITSACVGIWMFLEFVESNMKWDLFLFYYIHSLFPLFISQILSVYFLVGLSLY